MPPEGDVSLRPVVVDACGLLNLLATGREIDLVRAVSWTLIMTEFARGETLYLDSRPDAAGRRRRAPASTELLEQSGLFTVRMLDDDWIHAFVQCAEQLPDSDASCVALAGTLGYPLLSDDSRISKVASQLYSSLELISTLDLVRNAANALALGRLDLVVLAQNLRWRGNFLPPRGSPHREWYASLLSGEAAGSQ